ncbi:MAG: SRPBCC domain-containing protein [Pseudomonadota bacterium]
MTLPFLKPPVGGETVIVEAVFKTSPERAFRAWTNEDEVVAWFGPGNSKLQTAEIDLRVGGRWRFDYGTADGRQDVLEGEYREIEADKRLVFTWIHTRSFRDGRVESTPASQVTVTFTESGDSVLVRLAHERIVTGEGRLGVSEGWSGTFVNLEAHLGARQVE